MLFKEVVVVYFENRVDPVNTFSKQHAELGY
jgi:hypothetical protein